MSEEPDGETATKQVTFYLTPSEHERLQREKEESRQGSLSAFCAHVFRQRWEREETDRLAEEYGAAERLERISQEAADDIEESVEAVERAARNLNDLHARAATYPLVNFRALKRAHDLPEPWIDDQFKWASAKLRDGETAVDDPDVEGDGGTDADSSPSLLESLEADAKERRPNRRGGDR